METVACDYCGGRETVPVASQTDILHKTTQEVFTIVACRGCGLHFTNPRPAPSEMGRYYSPEYSFHSAPSGLKLRLLELAEAVANSPLAPCLDLVPMLGRRLAACVRPPLPDPVRRWYSPRPGGRILDIGCGAGTSAHFWGRRGSLIAYRDIAEVHGVEVSDSARAQLDGTGIPSYPSLRDVPPGLLFQVIRMNWSIEHVHSPTEYFRFFAERLADDGVAVLALPNYDGVLYRLAKDCVELPIHLYHFRPRDVANYTAKFRLRVLESQTFSYPQMLVAAAQACPSLRGSFDGGLTLSEARQLQNALHRLSRIGLGNDMLFILCKEGSRAVEA